jgi:putative ABC transport system permease protein
MARPSACRWARRPRRSFPSSAFPKRIRIQFRQRDWRTVVGVVGDIREFGLDAAMKPEMYVPAAQVVRPTMSVVLRAIGEEPVVAAARAALAEIDPDQPIFDVRTMGERLTRSLEQRRFTLVVLEIFAALALVMAALGLYALMAHSVAQRTHEIGVRMALGAQRLGVVALVARESLALVGAGALVGLAGSLVLARLMTQLLYGVDPADPIALAGSVGVLAAVAALATYLPVRRASRVDPMVALRYE